MRQRLKLQHSVQLSQAKLQAPHRVELQAECLLIGQELHPMSLAVHSAVLVMATHQASHLAEPQTSQLTQARRQVVHQVSHQAEFQAELQAKLQAELRAELRAEHQEVHQAMRQQVHQASLHLAMLLEHHPAAWREQ